MKTGFYIIRRKDDWKLLLTDDGDYMRFPSYASALAFGRWQLRVPIIIHFMPGLKK